MDNQQKWVYLLATIFKYMEKTDYLSELKKPHLSLKNPDNGDQVNRSIQDYLTDLEKLRLLFVDSLSSCREAVALAYLDELVDMKKVLRFLVEGREGIIIPRRLSSAYNFPFPSLRTKNAFMYGLIESVEKSIDFVKVISPVPPTKEVAFDEEDDCEEPHLEGTDETKSPEAEEIPVNSGWYTVEEVCNKYHLPKNNIKNRQWRINHGFPTHQNGPYSRPLFSASEVEEWLKNSK